MQRGTQKKRACDVRRLKGRVAGPMSAPTLLLAPMQGITDGIFRDFLTELGGIDACVSVYARVSNQPLPAHALLRTCPEMASGGCTRHRVPVVLQLLGGDPETMAETARRAAEAGAIGIDLNFGCPVARVNRHDGGAALLRDPDRITRIVRAVRDAVPRAIPVSAKVRAGWSHFDEAPSLALAVEQGGASLLTMHARTRLQQYGGQANWEAIAQAQRAVRIPVVANGDIRSPKDLARCAEQTGCDRFMIGRGAVAQPELFRVLTGREQAPWSSSRRLAWLASYGDACFAKGIPDGGVVGRVKAIWRYMAEVSAPIAEVFVRERRRETWSALRAAMSP